MRGVCEPSFSWCQSVLSSGLLHCFYALHSKDRKDRSSLCLILLCVRWKNTAADCSTNTKYGEMALRISWPSISKRGESERKPYNSIVCPFPVCSSPQMVLPAIHTEALMPSLHRARFLGPFVTVSSCHLHLADTPAGDGWTDSRAVAPTRLFGKTKSRVFFWKWKEINDTSVARRWQIAMSIMMCIDYLSTPWLPVTCPFSHPSFVLNDSIHISVTVMRLYLLFRKWKSSIWPLYLTSGLVLCCGGLQTALPTFRATLSSFLCSYKDFI